MRRGIALLLVAGTLTTAYVAAPAYASAGAGFAPYEVVDPATDTMSVAIGDVTGDGLADLVATAYTDPFHGVGRELRVYAQRPDHSLATTPLRVTVDSSNRDNAMNVVLADLDGDGRLEALVTTYDGVQVFRESGDGLTYGRTVAVPQAWDVVAADVTGDGLSDLVVSTADGVHVLKQRSGDFVDARLTSTPSLTIAVGDVTDDGLADVLTSTNTGFDVRAQQPDGFDAPVSYATGAPDPSALLRGLAVGDTDGDGRAEVHVSAGDSASQARVVTWVQGNGGRLVPASVRASGATPGGILLADVAGDPHPDLVVYHGPDSDVRVSSIGVYDSTPGSAGPEVLYAVPGKGTFGWNQDQVAGGDLDADGSVDVASISSFYGLAVLRGARTDESNPPQDVTPPQTSILSGPSGTTYAHAATFTFGADEPGSTFACSLDSTAATSCTSPQTYSSLAVGTHTFSVTATDAARNVDPTPATSTFTVAPSADLAVAVNASSSTSKKGQTLSWTTQVRNSGPDPADGVVVTTSVPASLTGVAVAGGSCWTSGDVARCTLGSVPAGGSTTVTLSGTVLANKGVATSTSQVATTTHDLDPSDDSASATVKLGNGNGN